jgi:hypothetical protein
VNYANAQIRDRAVTGYQPFINIFSHISAIKVIEVPIGYFKFDTLSTEDKASLAGMGLEEDRTSKMWRGSPQPLDFSRLLAMGAHNGRQVPGGASCSGYMAYLYAMKAAKIFSHMSAATQTNTKIIAGTDLQSLGGPKDTSSQMALGDLSAMPGGKTQHLVPPQGSGTVLQAKVDANIYLPVNSLKGLGDYSVTTSYNPKGPGFLFPYFRGMLLADREFAVQIFQRFFFRGLTSDPAQTQAMWGHIKLGLRNISLLPCGLAISHMFFGIHLADMAKARIRFIIDKTVYQGFILEGDHVRIVNNNVICEPSSVTVLSGLLATISTTPVALVKLLGMIRVPTLLDGAQKYNTSNINTSRALFDLLRTIEFSDFTEAQSKEMFSFIDQISFEEKATEINTETIRDFLNFMAIGDFAILSKYPAFFKQQTFKKVDRVTIGLTIFGYQVPSPSYGPEKGDKVTLVISKETETDEANLNVMSSMPFRLVPFAAGVAQWTRLFSRQEYLLPKPDKRRIGQGFCDSSKTCMNVTAPHFLPLYVKIKTIANMHRTANEGKRKRALDAEEGGSKKRKGTAMGFDVSLV